MNADKYIICDIESKGKNRTIDKIINKKVALQ